MLVKIYVYIHNIPGNDTWNQLDRLILWEFPTKLPEISRSYTRYLNDIVYSFYKISRNLLMFETFDLRHV